MHDLWLLPRPLILASKSQARRALLAAAGIPFEGIDAAIDAKAQLLAMSGRPHTLHAALSLVRDGTVVAATNAEAHLTCRTFSEAFVDGYLALAGDSVLQSVGGYAVEGLGIHLFERIEGEQSTILGLPMLPLLRLLRDHGALAV